MSKRRWYDKWDEEIGSSATLAGAGVLGASMLGSDFFANVKEAAYMARHATRTVDQMVRGSEGERGVNNLIKANRDITKGYEATMDLLYKMRDTYKQNEDLSREASRLAVQLKGMAIQATAAGDSAANTMTGGIFKRIDDFFMDRVGSSKDARENLPKLQELYKSARQFYDAREKSEKTISELSKYIEEKGIKAVRENKGIENDLRGLTKQLDNTYGTEDELFNVDAEVSFIGSRLGKEIEMQIREDVKGLDSKIKEYGGGVDNTRTKIEQNTGITPYQNPSAWLDYGLNPLSVGITLGLAAKGFSKVLPRFIEGPIRKGLALPFSLVYSATKGSGKYAIKGVKNLAKKIKEAKKINSQGKIEEDGQEDR